MNLLPCVRIAPVQMCQMTTGLRADADVLIKLLPRPTELFLPPLIADSIIRSC